MDRDAVTGWVERYVRAWETNDAQDIGSLFTDDATYYTAPFRQPWKGQQAIVDGWLDRKDEPGDWTFRFEILGIDADLAFVRGWTDYPNDPEPRYTNLWVIRLSPDGRASEFIEWWMAEDET